MACLVLRGGTWAKVMERIKPLSAKFQSLSFCHPKCLEETQIYIFTALIVQVERRAQDPTHAESKLGHERGVIAKGIEHTDASTPGTHLHQNLSLKERTPRRARFCAVEITPKAELVFTPELYIKLSVVFGLAGLKWFSALKASARNSRLLCSLIRNTLVRLKSKFSNPGPYVSVGGVLPKPSVLAGGRTKLAGLNGYHNLFSVVDGGGVPAGTPARLRHLRHDVSLAALMGDGEKHRSAGKSFARLEDSWEKLNRLGLTARRRYDSRPLIRT
jgi:hypothetical protein